MICEFALEPSLLNNWPNFRYFVGNFGIPRGRLISRYPSAWKRLVYESLGNCGEVERARIEESLRRIDDRIIGRPNSIWTDGQGWLPNAEAEHKRKAFHAIIASANPTGSAAVLDGHILDDANPLWSVPTAVVVARTATAMAQVVAPLLRASKELKFIDPHFDPRRIDFRNVLQEALSAASHQRDAGPILTVELHTSDADNKLSTQMFKESCERSLPAIIPNGMTVYVCRWRQRDGGEKLHNRYVLTELGGVQFHVGLNEGDPGETDEIDLLAEEVYRLRRAQYDVAAPAFDLADDLTIQGTRR
jgi:hypothetical protein